MKLSKRNIANARAAREKIKSGPPPVSKYAAKRRAQLREEDGPMADVLRQLK